MSRLAVQAASSPRLVGQAASPPRIGSNRRSMPGRAMANRVHRTVNAPNAGTRIVLSTTMAIDVRTVATTPVRNIVPNPTAPAANVAAAVGADQGSTREWAVPATIGQGLHLGRQHPLQDQIADRNVGRRENESGGRPLREADAVAGRPLQHREGQRVEHASPGGRQPAGGRAVQHRQARRRGHARRPGGGRPRSVDVERGDRGTRQRQRNRRLVSGGAGGRSSGRWRMPVSRFAALALMDCPSTRYERSAFSP